MKKVLTSRIFSILLIMVICVAGYSILYLWKKPKKIEVNNIIYDKIEKEEYMIDETEMNQGFFEKLEFTFNNDEIENFKNLKDYYVGRNDPFVALDISNREQVVNTEKIEEDVDEQNQEDEDIVY